MRSLIFSAWKMSASDWRSDKGQIIWSETPFFLSIKLWRSVAVTTTHSLTSVSPITIPVRSLRSFYVKQPCVAYSSIMLLSKLYTVHGLAVTCACFCTEFIESAWFQRSCNVFRTPSYSSYASGFLWCNAHYSDHPEFEPKDIPLAFNLAKVRPKR